MGVQNPIGGGTSMKRILSYSVAIAVAALVTLGCAGTPPAKVADAGGAPGTTTTQAAPAQTNAVSGAAVQVKPDTTPLDISLIHVNDTHAHLEPAYSQLTVDINPTLKGKRVFVELGGFARLWAAVDALRAEHPTNLFVHAGDVFQGTLFFTEFKGKADLDFLNAMKLDAMTVGNHEFDLGPAVLVDFAEGAHFPLVACNLDLSAEPALASVIKPYVIKEIKGAKVALVGLANPDTPYISSPGPNVKFLDPKTSLEKTVKALEAQGINKIIVLSHDGYDVDKQLAAQVAGVDVIIGGHSHTPLGPLTSLGIKSEGSYPTVVTGPTKDPVLVVTSWIWANTIGDLNVSFNGDGKIVAFDGRAPLLAGLDRFRVYDLPDENGKLKRVEFIRQADGSYVPKEYDGKGYNAEPSVKSKAAYLADFNDLVTKFSGDSRFFFVKDKPEGLTKLAQYSKSINELKNKIATTAGEELKRVNNKGPGPIIADSMRWKTEADIAIMNPGGVRVDYNAGPISVAQVYELQPFGNTLMTLNVNGAEVKQILEDMTDFCITSYVKAPDTAYVYVSGLKLTLMVNGPKGNRVTDIQVQAKDGSWKAIDPAGTYKLVVNNFMGTGGDKNFTLGKMPDSRKVDTGFIDSEAFLDYVSGKTLMNNNEVLVKNVM
jgi:5'-nucleotidase